MEIIYRADDGTEFDSLYECEQYEAEARIEQYEGRIVALDCNDNKMTLADGNFYSECMVVYLEDNEAVDFFKDGSERESVSYYGVDGPGVYVWGDSKWVLSKDEERGWIPLDEVLKEYHDKTRSLESLISLMKN